MSKGNRVWGLEFERATREALKKIASAPDCWPVGKQGTRHYLMERFPFIIHYLDMPDRIWIVAFAHTSRKPNYWKTKDPVGRIRGEAGSFRLINSSAPLGKPGRAFLFAVAAEPALSEVEWACRLHWDVDVAADTAASTESSGGALLFVLTRNAELRKLS